MILLFFVDVYFAEALLRVGNFVARLEDNIVAVFGVVGDEGIQGGLSIKMLSPFPQYFYLEDFAALGI